MAAEDGIKAPPAIQDKLRKLGLTRRDDLVLHLPLRYEDETSITLIGEAMPGVPVQVDAEVLDVSVQFRPRRQLVATVADASGELTLRFLNFYGSQTKQLEKARDDGRRLGARAQHIRSAGVLAAIAARIGQAHGAADDDGERQRTNQIGRDDGNNGIEGVQRNSSARDWPLGSPTKVDGTDCCHDLRNPDQAWRFVDRHAPRASWFA